MGQDISYHQLLIEDTRAQAKANFLYTVSLIRLIVVIGFLCFSIYPILSLFQGIDLLFFEPIRYNYVWLLDNLQPYKFVFRCSGKFGSFGQCWELSKFIPTNLLQNCYQQEIPLNKCMNLILDLFPYDLFNQCTSWFGSTNYCHAVIKLLK